MLKRIVQVLMTKVNAEGLVVTVEMQSLAFLLFYHQKECKNALSTILYILILLIHLPSVRSIIVQLMLVTYKKNTKLIELIVVFYLLCYQL